MWNAGYEILLVFATSRMIQSKSIPALNGFNDKFLLESKTSETRSGFFCIA
jgi:hypothetical protein